MVRKILIFLLINLFVFSKSYSLDFNKVYNVKIFSSAKLEVNDTNLIDQENAETLVENIEDLDAVLIKKSNEIKKQNRNRKTQKFKGAEDIYSDYADSVVYIKNIKNNNNLTYGSGFIVNYNGLKVITNWHVIEGNDKLVVYLKPKNFEKITNGEYSINKEDRFFAEVINFNKKRDLALLKVSNLPLKVKPVKYGKFKNVKIGETLFAIGHPEGLLWTFSSGMVSQIRPNYDWKYRGSRHHANVIQVQVPINPGNSGGPLFNTKGEVIGINTAIISQSGGSIGLGFAIPSNSAKKITKQLNEFGRTIRGWLGVQITAVSKEISESLGLLNEKGAFISNINPDGPSKAAGLQEGDVILKFNNVEIVKMTDLPRIVAESDVGSIALVEIWRKNKIITIEVKLGELPEKTFVKRSDINKNEKKYFVDSLNLTVRSNLGKDGVIVVEADDESKLIPGDLIIEINREPVITLDSFLELVETINKTGRNSLLLKVIREEKSIWVTIKFHR